MSSCTATSRRRARPSRSSCRDEPAGHPAGPGPGAVPGRGPAIASRQRRARSGQRRTSCSTTPGRRRCAAGWSGSPLEPEAVLVRDRPGPAGPLALRAALAAACGLLPRDGWTASGWPSTSSGQARRRSVRARAGRDRRGRAPRRLGAACRRLVGRLLRRPRRPAALRARPPARRAAGRRLPQRLVAARAGGSEPDRAARSGRGRRAAAARRTCADRGPAHQGPLPAARLGPRSLRPTRQRPAVVVRRSAPAVAPARRAADHLGAAPPGSGAVHDPPLPRAARGPHRRAATAPWARPCAGCRPARAATRGSPRSWSIS